MNTQPSDENLGLLWTPEIEDLESHVESRLNGLVRDFRLVLRSEGLILQGYTHSYYAKQLAQEAVLQGTALPILANDIEVV